MIVCLEIVANTTAPRTALFVQGFAVVDLGRGVLAVGPFADVLEKGF